MPKFKIVVRHADEEATWEEPYDKAVDPQAWAKDTIDKFNAGLRPGEKPRVLVDVIVTGESQQLDHTWEKTNLVTIAKGNQLYDTCQCTVCGITGKRFGLGSPARDPKYKAAKYAYCKVKK
jgi:hypothetical protein